MKCFMMENVSLFLAHQITGNFDNLFHLDTSSTYYLSICLGFFFYSDSIGNKGAFIRLKGDQMVPKYTTYDAVVSH
jgi:hypothetical protein